MDYWQQIRFIQSHPNGPYRTRHTQQLWSTNIDPQPSVGTMTHCCYEMGKGHQDRLTAYDNLPKDAQWNMTADFLATRYRLRGRIKPTQHLDHPSAQRISLMLNGRRLTSQLNDCIRFHVSNEYQLLLHMQSKQSWSDSTWDHDIDFDLFGKHYQRLSNPMQAFQSKLSHNQLPLGKIRSQCSAQVCDPKISLCPCCDTHPKDVQHFLQCPSRNDVIPSGLTALLKDSKFPESHASSSRWHATLDYESKGNFPTLLMGTSTLMNSKYQSAQPYNHKLSSDGIV